jgi:hypothetical protein
VTTSGWQAARSRSSPCPSPNGDATGGGCGGSCCANATASRVIAKVTVKIAMRDMTIELRNRSILLILHRAFCPKFKGNDLTVGCVPFSGPPSRFERQVILSSHLANCSRGFWLNRCHSMGRLSGISDCQTCCLDARHIRAVVVVIWEPFREILMRCLTRAAGSSGGGHDPMIAPFRTGLF